MDFLRKFLGDSGVISKECVKKVLYDVTEVFSKFFWCVNLISEFEANLIKVKEPVIIIGDIHG